MIIKVTIPNQIQLKVAPRLKSMFFSGKGEIHYIGGAEILPPPLNAEEESKAIPLPSPAVSPEPDAVSIASVLGSVTERYLLAI